MAPLTGQVMCFPTGIITEQRELIGTYKSRNQFWQMFFLVEAVIKIQQ